MNQKSFRTCLFASFAWFSRRSFLRLQFFVPAGDRALRSGLVARWFLDFKVVQ
jgi:hypothetical protein